MNKKVPGPEIAYETVEHLENNSINDVFDYLFRKLIDEPSVA